MKSQTPTITAPDGSLVPGGRVISLEDLASRSLEDESCAPYAGGSLELFGKNNLQAAISTLARDAAEGCSEARRELLDRVLGKPVQRADIRSTSVTLIGFLDAIAEGEPESNPGEGILDAEFCQGKPNDVRGAPADVSAPADELSLLR